jgi:hypothetical protein
MPVQFYQIVCRSKSTGKHTFPEVDEHTPLERVARDIYTGQYDAFEFVGVWDVILGSGRQDNITEVVLELCNKFARADNEPPPDWLSDMMTEYGIRPFRPVDLRKDVRTSYARAIGA